jgi:hypothetical protein
MVTARATAGRDGDHHVARSWVGWRRRSAERGDGRRLGALGAGQVILAQRHACYVKFTQRLFNVLRAIKADQLADDLSSEASFQYFADFAIRYLTAQLAACVAFVDAAEQRFQAQASAAIAQASCPVTPLSLSIRRSGAKARPRSIHLGSPTEPHQALSVSCTPHSGKLTISVATRSKRTPLSSLVGSRLQIGMCGRAWRSCGRVVAVLLLGGRPDARSPRPIADLQGSARAGLRRASAPERDTRAHMQRRLLEVSVDSSRGVLSAL